MFEKQWPRRENGQKVLKKLSPALIGSLVTLFVNTTITNYEHHHNNLQRIPWLLTKKCTIISANTYNTEYVLWQSLGDVFVPFCTSFLRPFRWVLCCVVFLDSSGCWWLLRLWRERFTRTRVKHSYSLGCWSLSFWRELSAALAEWPIKLCDVTDHVYLL